MYRLWSRLYHKVAVWAISTSRIYIGVPAGHTLDTKRSDVYLGYYQLAANLLLIGIFIHAIATGDMSNLGRFAP